MASLTGSTIAASYEQLLSLPDGGLNGNTLVAVTDGDSSTAIGMKVATSKIEIIPASDDANAFEVSNAAGTAILTINSSTTSASLVHTVTTATSTPKALFIDTNTSGVAAQDSTGMHIDFDRTVPGSGTAVHNDIGIDLDVNSASLGTSFVVGMDIDVVGHSGASAVHTATGLDVTVGSADTNYAASFGDTGNEVLVRLASNSNNARGFIYANNNNQIGFKDSDGDSVYQTGDNESHIWSTQGSETMRLTAGGELTLPFAKQLRWNTHGGNANSRAWGFGAGVIAGDPSADHFGISSSNADDNTLDTSVLVINKDGNVGIGVTPSAWDSDNTALQLGTQTAITNFGSGGVNSIYGHNVYENAGYKYIGTGLANMFLMSAGELNYRVAASGSAGNAITFATALAIDTAGAVTKPVQPAFLARASSDQSNLAINTDITVIYGTEVFDQGADFTVSTGDGQGGDGSNLRGLFTAPITGKYHLDFALNLQAVDSAADYYAAYIITSNRTISCFYVDPDFGQDNLYHSIGGSVLCDMDASDTAYIVVRQGGGSAQADLGAGDTQTFFSGYLAC
jgi:hypothetical protein